MRVYTVHLLAASLLLEPGFDRAASSGAFGVFPLGTGFKFLVSLLPRAFFAGFDDSPANGAVGPLVTSGAVEGPGAEGAICG